MATYYEWTHPHEADRHSARVIALIATARTAARELARAIGLPMPEVRR